MGDEEVLRDFAHPIKFVFDPSKLNIPSMSEWVFLNVGYMVAAAEEYPHCLD